MSPRGVPIQDIREQLFDAAKRVLLSKGPNGVTSREIAREAGVSVGLLFNHFGDLDTFLAELVLDRAQLAAGEAAKLPARAGKVTVAGNLTAAALEVLRSDAFLMASIGMARPSLMNRVYEMTRGTPPALIDIENSFATYLEAEKKLGRIAANTDSEALAFSLVGAVHHIFMSNRTEEPGIEKHVGRIVNALLAGLISKQQK